MDDITLNASQEELLSTLIEGADPQALLQDLDMWFNSESSSCSSPHTLSPTTVNIYSEESSETSPGGHLILGSPESDPMWFEQPLDDSTLIIPSESDITSKIDQLIKEEPKIKRTKKRARKEDDGSSDVSSVTLTQEQLLKFTSEDLDKFASNLASIRPLTAAEQKEIKKQRRKIKNRESAQASRERKKHQVDELEDTIKALKDENAILKDKLTKLTTENSSLKSQLAQLTQLAQQQQPVTERVITVSDVHYQPRASSSVTSTKVRAAGVTLLVVLFSFGLFLNGFKIPMAIPQQQQQYNGRVMEANIGNTIAQAVSTMRSLKSTIPRDLSQPTSSIDQQQHDTKEVTENQYDIGQLSKSTFVQQPTLRRATSIDGTNDRINNKLRNLSKSTTEETSDLSSTSSIFMNEFANESSLANETTRHDQITQWFNQNHQIPRNNTAYLICTRAQQIVPESQQPFNDKEPFYVSIIIPTQHQQNDTTDSVIEITAQIIDISISDGLPKGLFIDSSTSATAAATNDVGKIPILA